MAINKLSIQDVKNILEVVGALLYTVIMSVFDKFGPPQIMGVERLNSAIISAIHSKDYNYLKLNIAFHDVFLDLSENAAGLHYLCETVIGRLKPLRSSYGSSIPLVRTEANRSWPGENIYLPAKRAKEVIYPVC